MVLKVGDVGLDYSGLRPSPADVYKNGARFIIRYSAGVGSSRSNTAWKLCGIGEIRAAVAAGLDFIANSEWYETRVTEGAAAGSADGANDLNFWKSRGLARGAAIYPSWDAAPLQASWAAVDSYMRAYVAALKGYYVLGVYAGTPYLQHALPAGIARYGWRPNAGVWSRDGLPYQPAGYGRSLLATALKATPATIWQTGNYWYNKQADENLLIRVGCGSHLQALAAIEVPHGPVKPPIVIPRPTTLPRRNKPHWSLPRGHYLGLVTGPAQCHSGDPRYDGLATRRVIQFVQWRMQDMGFAPRVPGWADGIYGQPTVNAVAAWQRAKYRAQTSRFGEVWPDDYVRIP